MKRYLSFITNILAILIGLLGLNTPYITNAVIMIGLGGLLDPALLQPLFIGLIIIAIYGQFYNAKQTLSFLPIILEFIFGLLSFLFIFPFQNLIMGYLGLVGIFFLLILPLINKKIQKRKIVKIKV
jgi:flagellar biosynthesis protein FliQ